jgi:hypothetical protein
MSTIKKQATLFGRSISLVVIIAVVLGCIVLSCCGLMLAMPSPKETTSTVANTQAATSPSRVIDIPTLTSTPEPTYTLESTPTPEPSKTPKPTIILEPEPTPTSDTLSTSTPTPEPTTVQLCNQVEVKQVGREEPEYVGLTGYLTAKLDSRYYDNEIPSTPWQVPTLQQSGPNKWEETGENLPAKTPVIVLDQFLGHKGYGRYDGVLVVESLEDRQEYIIDVYRFTTTDYWNCPPHIAAKYSPFIARIVRDDVKPVNRSGEWGEIGSQKEVLCLPRLDYEINDTVENGVNCLLYKQYVNGFGGVEHTFPSESLEIVY